MLVEENKLFGFLTRHQLKILDILWRRGSTKLSILNTRFGRSQEGNIWVLHSLGLVSVIVIHSSRKEVKIVSLTDRGRRLLEALNYAASFIEDVVYAKQYWDEHKYFKQKILGGNGNEP